MHHSGSMDMVQPWSYSAGNRIFARIVFSLGALIRDVVEILERGKFSDRFIVFCDKPVNDG